LQSGIRHTEFTIDPVDDAKVRDAMGFANPGRGQALSRDFVMKIGCFISVCFGAVLSAKRCRHRACVLGAVLLTCLVATPAKAIPSFARKYNTSCQTCHTAFPMLNPFGEAFRRNGLRFPSVGGSVDSDATEEETIPLGQEEYEKNFPNSIWSDRISRTPPLSLQVQGGLYYAIPKSELEDAQGYNFSWNSIAGPVSLFAAGSFSDKLTYYVKVLATQAGTVKVSAAYLAWNDLVGPRHALNLWFGRLIAPQLTSYGVNSSYLTDKALPLVSVAGLFNPNVAPLFGAAPADGVELNGIALHSISYSAGWVASTAQTGLPTPNSEDFYFHVGAKFGGMSLDGEGSRGMAVANPERPWSETSLTLDTFGYRGVIVADNNINYPMMTPQRSAVNAIGHALRIHLNSLMLNGVFQYQSHHRPYPGSLPTPASLPDQPNTLPGAPDNSKGRGVVASAELAYVLFPWLVPAVRAEYTWLSSKWGKGSFMRIIPGVAALLRPNIRLYVFADIERAYDLPPTSPTYTGSWVSAGGNVAPESGKTKTSFEQIGAAFAWAL
jgi:hypothetical protein